MHICIKSWAKSVFPVGIEYGNENFLRKGGDMHNGKVDYF